MKNKTVEKILLTKFVSNISFDNPFTKKVFEKDIKGLYIWGSRLWGNDTKNSDLDYVVVLSNNSPIFIGTDGYIQKESETIDIHFLSETEYKKRLDECDEMVLSCYIQINPLLEYKCEIDLNKTKLRKSFSAKANNSYVKAKKKLTVEESTEKNLKLAWKSMWHSLRILKMGIIIANGIKNIDTKMLMNGIYGIEDNFKLYKNDWETLHKIYKPVYNQLSTEFKKLAPKN